MKYHRPTASASLDQILRGGCTKPVKLPHKQCCSKITVQILWCLLNSFRCQCDSRSKVYARILIPMQGPQVKESTDLQMFHRLQKVLRPFQRGAELFSRTYCTHLYQPLVQKCHALGKDRCVHIIQKRSLCSHNVSLSTKCSLFAKFYAFEVNIARHFIHMVCQKCRAYNHKIMNFETMLPPFNAWIHLFQSKFAHDKALFDSTTVLISKNAGLKRMRKRDHTSSRNQIPFTYVCLVQKACVVNKSAQIMGCGVTMWEERPMLANQHQASG